MTSELGQRGRRYLLVGRLAALVLLGTVVAPGIHALSEPPSLRASPGYELTRVQWALASIAPDGRSIWIGVPTGDCSKFYRADVIAVPRGFEVKVLNKEPVDGLPPMPGLSARGTADGETTATPPRPRAYWRMRAWKRDPGTAPM
jgi:hypothetical protein